MTLSFIIRAIYLGPWGESCRSLELRLVKSERDYGRRRAGKVLSDSDYVFGIGGYYALGVTATLVPWSYASPLYVIYDSSGVNDNLIN